MKTLLSACILAMGLLAPLATEETQALDWDAITTVTVESEKPVLLSFTTESAGLLALATRSDEDGDLQLRVLDAHRVALEDSRIDIDYEGNASNEQGAIVIPRAGQYFAVVEKRFGRGATTAQLGASWLAFPAMEQEDFAHSNPANAKALSPGEGHEGHISKESGQHWYWYSITSEGQGQVFLSTRAPVGDLLIEVYRDGQFIDPEAQVNNNEDGVRGNETANIRVNADETVYFRVRTHSLRHLREDIPFTIRTAFVDL